MQAPVRIVFYLRVREPWTNLGWQWVNPNQTKLGWRFRKCKELNTILVQIPKARFSTYADLSWSILFLRFLGSFNPTWDENSDLLEEIQRLDGDIQDTAIHKTMGMVTFETKRLKLETWRFWGDIWWHISDISFIKSWKHFSIFLGFTMPSARMGPVHWWLTEWQVALAHQRMFTKIFSGRIPWTSDILLASDLSAGWWFGTWLLFFHILEMSSSQLTFIFFRGVGIPPTSLCCTQILCLVSFRIISHPLKKRHRFDSFFGQSFVRSIFILPHMEKTYYTILDHIWLHIWLHIWYMVWLKIIFCVLNHYQTMFLLAVWKPDPIFTAFCWCTCEPFWCYGVGWGGRVY